MTRRFLFLAVLLAGLLAAPAAHAAITVGDATVAEGGDLKFIVTSDEPLVSSAEVTTSDGTAKAGSDYDATTDTLNFGPGGGEQEFVVKTKGDAAPEPDETLTVTVTPSISGDPDTGTGAIVNDDAPSLSIADVSLAENGGSAKLTIASQAISAPVSVDYATADGSAQAGSDFDARSGTVMIPAGQSSATIEVPVRNDDVDEEDESFKVALANGKGATIGDGEATVGIGNDDLRLVSVGDVSVVEGDGEQTIARFPVQLNAPTFRRVSVAFITLDGTARAPRDFLARFGGVIFEPGQQTAFIDVAITPDEVSEPSEAFVVLIGQAQGARVLREGALGVVRDDDTGGARSNDSESPRMKLTRPRLSGARSIRARVTCPRGEERCKGRLVLYTKVGKRERRIGSKSFSLPGDASQTLRIAIPRSILASARRTGRLAVRGYMLTSDAAGNMDTTTATVRLKVRRPRSAAR